MLETALILVAAGVILIVIRIKSGRSGRKQLERLTALLEKTKNSPEISPAAVKNLQNQIYALIHQELGKAENKTLYHALDLLKLYLGEGLGRPDDPSRITGVVSVAMRTDQTDVLGYSVHAFCPLIRKAPAEQLPQAVEQLCIIAATAMKKRKNFVTARAVEIILEALERMERAAARRKFPADTQAAGAETGAKAVRLVGIAILRGGDVALFREFCAKISEFITNSKGGLFSGMWPPVFAAWLNYLARRENETAFAILLTHLKSLTGKNNFDSDALAVLIGECRHMITVSSLNPYNTFAAPMLAFFLDAAFTLKNTALWRQAAACAQETAQTALERHDPKVAFPTIYPFLEIGRKLLLENLGKRPESERRLFAREALAALAREWVKTAEYEARRSFVLTVPEVIFQIRESWLGYPAAEGSEKSLNRFCHFLVIYWARLRPKSAGRTPQLPAMNFRGLLSEAEIGKLEFLF